MQNSYREEALTSLIQLLREGNEADRCHAAHSLGAIRADKAVDTLIERLRDDDIDVCIDAATALGEICLPDSVSSLLEALEKEPDGEIKTTIVSTLANFNTPEVKKVLSQLAVQRPDDLEDEMGDWDSYWDIQLEAIRSLTLQGGTDRIEEVLALIDDEDGQDIESEILKLLASSGEAGFRRLETRLTSSAPRAKRRVIQALRFQDSELSKDTIKKALHDEDEDVRMAALSSASHLNATELFSDIVSLISDPSAQVRTLVLSTLETLSVANGQSYLTFSRLIPLLGDEDSNVRTTILNLLNNIGKTRTLEFSEEDKDAIKNCLNTTSENVAEAILACRILSTFTADAETVEVLINILENTQNDESLRQEAAVCLGKFGLTTPAVMQALQQQISGKSRLIRLSVLQALLAIEKANQGKQVLKLTDTNTTLSDNKDSEKTQITDPMELLIASLYGDLLSNEGHKNGEESFEENPSNENTSGSQPEQQSEQQPEQHSELNRIDAINLDKNNRPLSVDASQSTLASMQANQPAIPQDYPSYKQLDDTKSVEVHSTLDALNQDNITASLMSQQPVEPHVQSIMSMINDLPEELQTFGDTVKANNSAAEQMLDHTKNTKPTDDVKHLTARIFADLDVSPEHLDATQQDKVERIIAGLILALSDEDEQLRCEAASTIGQLALKNPKTPGLSNAFGGLVTQLQFGTPQFRVKAVKALGALEHKAGIPPLVECLEDSDANVRTHSIYALDRLMKSKWSDQKASHHMVLESVTSEKIIQKILTLLSDSSNTVRRAGIELLTNFQHLDAVETMISIALENNGAMAREVGKSLRKMNASNATLIVTKRLKEEKDAKERSYLIEIIEEMFKPESTTSFAA